MIEIVGNQLSQWDVGRSITVTGCEASHIHLANQGDSSAVIRKLVAGSATIPDYLLRTGKTLLAYAVLDGVTLESRSFSVQKRERPEDYIYEEDQRNYIYKLTDDVQSAIAAANQAAQDILDAKERGEFKGEPGYTPQKGVDYYTKADKEELVAAVIAALPNGDEVVY